MKYAITINQNFDPLSTVYDAAGGVQNALNAGFEIDNTRGYAAGSESQSSQILRQGTETILVVRVITGRVANLRRCWTTMGIAWSVQGTSKTC